MGVLLANRLGLSLIVDKDGVGRGWKDRQGIQMKLGFVTDAADATDREVLIAMYRKEYYAGRCLKSEVLILRCTSGTAQA
jgi:hypothetical protein